MNRYYLLVVFLAFTNTLSNLLIKTGAGKIGKLPDNFIGIPGYLGELVTNWFLVGGLALFGLGFAIWVLVLNKVQLSTAAPIMSLGYVFIMIFSYLLLKESITTPKIIGVLTIIFGVFLITR